MGERGECGYTLSLYQKGNRRIKHKIKNNYLNNEVQKQKLNFIESSMFRIFDSESYKVFSIIIKPF